MTVTSFQDLPLGDDDCGWDGAAAEKRVRAWAGAEDGPNEKSFVYVRMHGPDDDTLYAGSYSDDDLAWWAERIREWHDCGRDVLVYFNNDGDGNAVRNARTLRDQCR